MLLVMFAHSRRHGRGSISSCRRASSRSRTPASSSASPKAAADISFAPWRRTSGRSPTSCARIRRWTYVNSTVGAGGPNLGQQYRRAFVALKPRSEREASAGGHRRLRARRNVVPGMRSFSSRSRTSISAAGSRRAQYQYTLQSSDTEALYQRRAGNARQDRQDSRPARRHQRPPYQESADDASRSTAKRRRSMA